MSPAIRYDFRSDTVTRPGPPMRAAMAAAKVGDDVFGDVPTVNRLEATVCDTLGKESALFVSSGTQANLIALMSHCERGDEYIVGQKAHCYRWEAGGAAALGSIRPRRARRFIPFYLAAGLYALEHNVDRLEVDHTNARILAQGLSTFPGLTVSATRISFRQ